MWCTLPLLTTQIMPQFVHVLYLLQNGMLIIMTEVMIIILHNTFHNESYFCVFAILSDCCAINECDQFSAIYYFI